MGQGRDRGGVNRDHKRPERGRDPYLVELRRRFSVHWVRGNVTEYWEQSQQMFGDYLRANVSVVRESGVK